ncbi:MAG: translation initiation factor IF-1 [Gemmatimonadetes bacterium]|jgi:translation initiation factor IF-1|nr:translation initiation factor IF-1 [Gemmatimonadota bacterium]MDE2699057.1 translation initiation factor IF-1 [Gemmatimonadota bacterium]MDE2724053.1 translation initiation factor IF-1 [Gemmatimonadota bacterium]MXZ12037.1 translation initiation factor IF-1 [Gemmatimonadota bacterium]MYC15621.1 translation initiation factor IF-1 [Gemmatimonadota bacterium]
MAKEEKVVLEGTIVDILPDGQYKVEIEGGHQILGYTSGKMRRFNIRIVVGDTVTIETSPYDLNRGRITFRDSGTGGPPPPSTQGGGSRRPGRGGRSRSRRRR